MLLYRGVKVSKYIQSMLLYSEVKTYRACYCIGKKRKYIQSMLLYREEKESILIMLLYRGVKESKYIQSMLLYSEEKEIHIEHVTV